MIRCEECYAIIKKRYKSKHEQSKKHKCFSNLFLKKFVIKYIAVDKIKDAITAYYNEHIKNIKIFTVSVYCQVDDMTNYKISVPTIVSFAVTAYN